MCKLNDSKHDRVSLHTKHIHDIDMYSRLTAYNKTHTCIKSTYVFKMKNLYCISF
jgi:hypothetical protein